MYTVIKQNNYVYNTYILILKYKNIFIKKKNIYIQIYVFKILSKKYTYISYYGNISYYFFMYKVMIE